VLQDSFASAPQRAGSAETKESSDVVIRDSDRRRILGLGESLRCAVYLGLLIMSNLACVNSGELKSEVVEKTCKRVNKSLRRGKPKGEVARIKARGR
jgi:hypothetical protein